MELVYVLALLPAVLWGFSPILSKRGMASGGSSLQASLTVVAVDSSLYGVALLVRQGLDVAASLTLAGAALFLTAGIVGTAVGRLAVFAGVDRVGASINSAVISTRPFFAGLLAVVFLGERVTLVTLSGIVVLVVGLTVLALSRGGDRSGWQPRDLLYPLAAAAAFGVGNVARKFGLDAFAGVTLLEAVALNELGAMVALGTYAVVADRRDIFDAPRRSYAYFAGSGTITAVALLSLFAALQIGRVVVVDPLTATAPLFTAVFAAVFLRDLERVTLRLVLGAILVVVGVVLIVVDPSLVL
ncbi:EamA family transporter [Haloarculaceae archaeon H-GB2-1]|nr:EamA family transporter [Haloarculaceae archaeon H-GB1-1]MEA5388527.1 EamA family transporter [Haloarculaceae archaeon H-GB11]MEA5406559.1 EamA family transporter [Haloarculaceae archaeon H-GB2-1]